MNQTQSPQAGTPGQSASNQGRPAVPPYQPPTNPEQVAKEQERISLLLEINNEILQHVSSLQSEGQGGVMAGQQGSTGQKPPTQEYISCMRSVQYNVAWVGIAVQGGVMNPGSKTSYGPLSMDPPVRTPGLIEKYAKLNALFPGWKGPAATPVRQQSSGTPPQNRGPQIGQQAGRPPQQSGMQQPGMQQSGMQQQQLPPRGMQQGIQQQPQQQQQQFGQQP